MTSKKHDTLAFRLGDILVKLNTGERIDIHALAQEYQVHIRTLQRDLNERLTMLAYTEAGPRYYRIDKNKQGHLNQEEIKRIARFASIQELFPEVDRRFFQEKLQQSITIKGFQYENIRHKQKEFDTITQAIKQQQYINFTYTKVRSKDSKTYQIEPYHLVNKNGIWYLVGLDNGKEKSFCFNQISNLALEKQTFTLDTALLDKIRQTDSIFLGSQISEIIIKIAPRAAGYFKRRNLLPNQETIRELEDGSLLLACKNVSPMEVVPIVQYWIPHAHIISPSEIQQQMENTLKQYLNY
ncbi:helix-turn-helix transcriptional regulator [Rappaport israeli]|uniref:helix-turn-helix transcriptional regulator n=1 Tax=Rappaport israeli TaxID=1839807 RepID=UPI00093008F0|nr:WYL domain-containing protein [Rappaport israeli]